KAKWFNHEWIKQTDNIALIVQMRNVLIERGIQDVDPVYLDKVLSAVKERMTYISDFWGQASFFFQQPDSYDVEAIKPKWNAQKTSFFEELIAELKNQTIWEAPLLESFFK